MEAGETGDKKRRCQGRGTYRFFTVYLKRKAIKTAAAAAAVAVTAAAMTLQPAKAVWTPGGTKEASENTEMDGQPAKEGNCSDWIVREVTYISEEREKTFPFPETISENGEAYILDSVSREILSSEENPKPSQNMKIVMSESFADPEENHVPAREILENGTRYYLKSWTTIELNSGSEGSGGSLGGRMQGAAEKAVQAVYSDRPPAMEDPRETFSLSDTIQASEENHSVRTYTIRAAARYVSGAERLETVSAGEGIWNWFGKRKWILWILALAAAGMGVLVFAAWRFRKNQVGKMWGDKRRNPERRSPRPLAVQDARTERGDVPAPAVQDARIERESVPAPAVGDERIERGDVPPPADGDERIEGGGVPPPAVRDEKREREDVSPPSIRDADIHGKDVLSPGCPGSGKRKEGL